MIELRTKEEAEKLFCPFWFNNAVVRSFCLSEQCHGWVWVLDTWADKAIPRRGYCGAIHKEER